jgi:RNA polymerase sigma-70 factor (ECF subfamily)
MPVEERVAELLARGRGDEAATLAIEALGPEILGYLRALLRDDADASDAFSVFAEATWKGLPGFRGEASLRAWCYRIAYHAVLSQKRDPYRRRKDRLDTSFASQLAGRVFASTALERERQSDALARLRDALEPDEQTLLTLRVDRQLSWREVAEVLAGDGQAEPADEAALRKRFERLKEKLGRAARELGLAG